MSLVAGLLYKMVFVKFQWIAAKFVTPICVQAEVNSNIASDKIIAHAWNSGHSVGILLIINATVYIYIYGFTVMMP